MQTQQIGLKNMLLERYNNFRVGHAINNKQSIFLECACGVSAVERGGLMWRNVGVSGPQDILRPMQAVLHIYGSLAN